MIGIFHKEATVQNFRVLSTKQRLVLQWARSLKVQVNITITNRDLLKVVFKKKTVILDSYIKEKIGSG